MKKYTYEQIIEFEKKHCEELQTAFLKLKGFEDDEMDCSQAELMLVSQEYWNFVEDYLNGN